MSVSLQPNITTSGLVFCYDMNNIRSYAGPPIQNVLNQITPRGQSVTPNVYNFTSGVEDVTIPTLGVVTNCNYMNMYNNYSASGSCCPSPFDFGSSLPVSGNTQYTYAILYKSVNGYSNPNYMYHYEYGSSGYITEYGVHGVSGYGSQVTDLGDGWTWSASVFTTNASTTILHTGAWMYEYNTYNRLYVAKVMITPGDYRSLHPRYWPNVNTTRTSTQAIKDLTGNNTITATSLTYNSDGSFSFNASSNYISCNSPVNLPTTSNGTVLVWCKPDSSRGGAQEQYTGLVSYGGRDSVTPSNSRLLSLYTNGSTIYVSSAYWGNDYTPNSLVVTPDQWNFVGMISRSSPAADNTTLICGNASGFNYQTGSSGNYNYGLNTTLQNLAIGATDYPGRLFKGQIAAVQIYNRELSISEIRQNFNAHRGRYGI